MTREEMRELLEEVFEERARIDAETHGQHHGWIQERIEAEEARKEMFWSIAKSAASWSVLAVLGYFSGHIGDFFKWICGLWPN